MMFIDKVNKKDTLIIQGDWNAKVGVDAEEDWADYCGPLSNDITNDKGIFHIPPGYRQLIYPGQSNF